MGRAAHVPAPLSNDDRAAAMQDTDALCSKIDALLDASERGDLAHLEHTLTDGYAKALALEAERWRIEKRIAEVAGLIGSGDLGGGARELSGLVNRLERTDGELARLRGVLADLRRRADVVRSAVA